MGVVYYFDLPGEVCYYDLPRESDTLTYQVMSITLTLWVVSVSVTLTYQVMPDILKLTVHFLTRWSGSRRFAPTRLHQPISGKNTN